MLTPIEDQPDIEVVAEVADGRSALVEAIHLVPDVALVDIGLPDIEGLEVIQLMTEVIPDLRVVALVVDEPPDLQFDALRAGAGAVAVKERIMGWTADLVRRAHEHEPMLPRPLAALLAERFDKLMAVAGASDSRLTDTERALLEAMADDGGIDSAAAGVGCLPGVARNAVTNVLLRLRATDPPAMRSRLDEVVDRLG